MALVLSTTSRVIRYALLRRQGLSSPYDFFKASFVPFAWLERTIFDKIAVYSLIGLSE